MKNISTYISEKLRISSKPSVEYHPNSKTELVNILDELIDKRGENADLNDIDVTHITDMSETFYLLKMNKYIQNIDVSEWNVSNVTKFSFMFSDCHIFNSDLSQWNMSNAYDIQDMFLYCYRFDSDLSHWDVSNVTNFLGTFNGCKKFNCDLSKWDVSKGKQFEWMFQDCISFNCDLSDWKISDKLTKRNIVDMFRRCNTLDKLPNWYTKWY